MDYLAQVISSSALLIKQVLVPASLLAGLFFQTKMKWAFITVAVADASFALIGLSFLASNVAVGNPVTTQMVSNSWWFFGYPTAWLLVSTVTVFLIRWINERLKDFLSGIA